MSARRARHLALALCPCVIACVAGIISIGVVDEAWAAPQPDPVPRRWQMQFEPGSLRVTVVDVEDLGSVPVFYMTYKTTNLSDRELYLAPLFELATDEGDIIRSGRGVPAEVYAKLLDRIKNPLLRDEISIQGTIRQGRENAKEGLVVWALPDVDMDEVVVYAAGFSGETRTVPRPDTGTEVVLRKTVMLRHPVPGEIDPNINPTLQRSTTQWILR